jgi:ABC-2 type transport system ATP-binding protein
MTVAATTSLTVRYGRKVAVGDLSVEVPGGCVGLLGPNGAGKTTLIKTLLGFLRPAHGRATVLGMDVASAGLRIRQLVGLMPEQDCHIPGMNAVAFVAYAGELAGMPGDQAMRRAHETLEYCGLGEARYRDIETYSTGMKQRIKLAQALIHGPKLLLLDEPTNGLDPAGRVEMLDLIRDISSSKGVNVVVSSHLLPDIERTCDHVIVMRSGRLAMSGSVADLRRTEGVQVDVDLKVMWQPFLAALRAAGVNVVHEDGSRCRLALPETEKDAAALILRTAMQTGAQVRGIRPALRSLEDVFLEAIE